MMMMTATTQNWPHSLLQSMLAMMTMMTMTTQSLPLLLLPSTM